MCWALGPEQRAGEGPARVVTSRVPSQWLSSCLSVLPCMCSCGAWVPTRGLPLSQPPTAEPRAPSSQAPSPPLLSEDTPSLISERWCSQGLGTKLGLTQPWAQVLNLCHKLGRALGLSALHCGLCQTGKHSCAHARGLSGGPARLGVTALAGCQGRGWCSSKVAAVMRAGFRFGLLGSPLVLFPPPRHKPHPCFPTSHRARQAAPPAYGLTPPAPPVRAPDSDSRAQPELP